MIRPTGLAEIKYATMPGFAQAAVLMNLQSFGFAGAVLHV